MCWISSKLKIKTAKKDIPVWKIIRSSINNSPNECRSFYENFTYIKDILETTPISFKVRKYRIEGYMGFLSYSSKLSWDINNDIIIVFKKGTLFSTGYTISTHYIIPGIRIAKFHIPKGYRYAENNEGEIISSAIIFDNFID